MTKLIVEVKAIPQSFLLENVRRVTAAANGCTTTEISERTGLERRQVLYAVRAARTLGWAKADGRKWSATPDGKKLLSTEAGSEPENSWIRRAIESSPLLKEIAPDLLADVPPSRAALIARIRKRTDPPAAKSTADRAAGALLSWRTQLLGEQQLVIWPKTRLPDALVRNILRENPWWQGHEMMMLPPVERDFVQDVRRRIGDDLAPIVVVRGPRQVGKTTAQLQIIEQLLKDGVPPARILRVQWDELPSLSKVQEPILRLVEWYEGEVLREKLNTVARRDGMAFLFFDEIQNLPDWHTQLKHLVDNTSVKVVVTGSSALRIEAGRDSLAGRISTIEVGTLTVREISAIRGFGEIPAYWAGPDLTPLGNREFWTDLLSHLQTHRELRLRAFAEFSTWGGYPIAHKAYSSGWAYVAQQLNENVIRKVIQHDLRVGESGRKRDPILLEELFRLACRCAGQTPKVRTLTEEIQLALNANIGVKRVRAYLEFLNLTLLLQLVRPLELRLKRAHAPHKLCLADHGLRASWLGEVVPIDEEGLKTEPHLTDLAGHIAESVLGTYLQSIHGLDLSHYPGSSKKTQPGEVDFVITIGTQRIPIEVKYRANVRNSDLANMRAFLDKAVYNASFGLLVTRDRDFQSPDPRIVPIPLSAMLCLR